MKGKKRELEELGRGTHGVVYFKPKTMTALKSLEIGEPSHPQMGLSISVLREYHTLKTMVPHPNVMGYIDSYIRDDRLFIELEYLPLTLRDLMRERITLESCRKYAAHMLSGIDHCHQRMKILHRDIKPENLLIGFDGNLKLADFGVPPSPVPAFCVRFSTDPSCLAKCRSGEGHAVAPRWRRSMASIHTSNGHSLVQIPRSFKGARVRARN